MTGTLSKALENSVVHQKKVKKINFPPAKLNFPSRLSELRYTMLSTCHVFHAVLTPNSQLLSPASIPLIIFSHLKLKT